MKDEEFLTVGIVNANQERFKLAPPISNLSLEGLWTDLRLKCVKFSRWKNSLIFDKSGR